jgi:hypothetical protein
LTKEHNSDTVIYYSEEAFMKKIGFLLVIAFAALGVVSAQGWGSPWGGMAQPVTVEGTLQLQNGQIALSTGNAVYFVPALTRYVGFIDGLKEGARVSVSGYASGNVLQAAQITVSGRAYDLLANNFGGYGAGCGCGYCYGQVSFNSGRGGWGMRGFR